MCYELAFVNLLATQSAAVAQKCSYFTSQPCYNRLVLTKTVAGAGRPWLSVDGIGLGPSSPYRRSDIPSLRDGGNTDKCIVSYSSDLLSCILSRFCLLVCPLKLTKSMATIRVIFESNISVVCVKYEQLMIQIREHVIHNEVRWTANLRALYTEPRVLLDSCWSPSAVHQESTWSPTGVHQEFTRSPTGVHQEFTRSPTGVQLESN
jgi:hypothetical protein